MARQSTTPVTFDKSRRVDTNTLMSSGRAGVVVPVGYAPLLRGDSASGRFGIDIELADMPRPLLNAVTANLQAWFVPKSAHPQFSGWDEFMHSYQGQDIKALGQADRTPPSFFHHVTESNQVIQWGSEMYKTLGLHRQGTAEANTDLVDAFSLIYNFRLAAHSSKLARRQYGSEHIQNSTKLPAAFWPSGRFARVVPDYERALIVGAMDLDVSAGQVPINTAVKSVRVKSTGRVPMQAKNSANGNNVTVLSNVETGPANAPLPAGALRQQGTTTGIFIDPMGNLEVNIDNMVGNIAGQRITTSLADIDKARTTQAFANLRTAYAGNDATGFDNDDVLVAELMQGFRVPEQEFHRPWLLDQKRVTFGLVERSATDAANLDVSVTRGRASATLSVNVPAQDAGGVIIFTLEVLPERIDERMSDQWLNFGLVSDFPDALRDIQRVEPVDLVQNHRLDAKHAQPNGLYGYEPMNDKWNREYTRLGGAFYQETPGAPWTEQRAGIWLPEIVNPTFTGQHFLAPSPFPHDVFSDKQAPAFEFVARHSLAIVGLTQFGDVLAENNDDYQTVKDA